MMGTVKVNDIEIAYKLYTPKVDPDRKAAVVEKAPVVLVNGLADTKETWAAQIPAFLDAGFSVLTFDNRGIGASSRPPGLYTAEMMAADLKGLVKALLLPSPFHLIGVSMGGMIAQSYALANPSDVLSLTLACTYAAPGPFCSRMFDFWADVSKKMSVAAVMRDVTLWGFTQDFFKPEHSKEVEEVEAAMRDIDLSTDEYLSQLNTIQTFDSRKDITNLSKLKVLVLAGDEDILIPTTLSRELHEMIPRSKWATVKGGHCCLWEFPDSFNKAAVSFLEDVQSSIAVSS